MILKKKVPYIDSWVLTTMFICSLACYRSLLHDMRQSARLPFLWSQTRFYSSLLSLSHELTFFSIPHRCTRVGSPTDVRSIFLVHAIISSKHYHTLAVATAKDPVHRRVRLLHIRLGSPSAFHLLCLQLTRNVEWHGSMRELRL